jgi:thioredoxin-like negative regulator of GroEL
MAKTEVKRLNDHALEELLVSENGYLAVAFMSHTSVPCDHFLPELAAMPELMKHRLKFFHLDVDENPTITGELGVTATPTLLILKGGEEIKKYEGPYTRQALKGRLEEVLLFKKPGA